MLLIAAALGCGLLSRPSTFWGSLLMAHTKQPVLSQSNYYIIVIKIAVSEELSRYMKNWRVFVKWLQYTTTACSLSKISSSDKQNFKNNNETRHDAEGIFAKAFFILEMVEKQRPGRRIPESGMVRLNTSDKMGRVVEVARCYLLMQTLLFLPPNLLPS